MERKAIGIQGISTASNYDDGACVEMLNVRHEQGVVKPVETFPVDFTLKKTYSMLYWHKNNGYAHLIGTGTGTGGGLGLYWIKNAGESNETAELLMTVSGPVKLSHTGNIVNVLDGETLKYIFWQEGQYYVIDLNFGISASTEPVLLVPTLGNVYNANAHSVTKTEITISSGPTIFFAIDNTFTPVDGTIRILVAAETRVDDIFKVGDEITEYCGQATSGLTVIAVDGSVDTITLSDATFTSYWFGFNGHDGMFRHTTGYQYQITFEHVLASAVNGTLHLTYEASSKDINFTVNAGANSVIIINAGVEDTTNSVSFTGPISKQQLTVTTDQQSATFTTIQYKITDNAWSTEQTVTFTIFPNSNSSTTAIQCSNNFTAELLSIVYNESFGIGLKVDGITRQGVKKIEGVLTNVTERDVRRYITDASFAYGTSGEFEADKTTRINAAKGLMKKAVGTEEKDGRLTGCFIGVVAIELYDGSYILNSPFLFMGAAFDEATRYNFTKSQTYDYQTNRFKIRSSFYYKDGETDIYPHVDINKLLSDGYNSFVADNVGIKTEDDDVFTNKYPFIYTDYTTHDEDFNLLASGVHKIATTISSNKLSYKINASLEEKYKNIIKSVSVFISPTVDIYDYENVSEFPYTSYYGEYTPDIKSVSDIIKELMAQTNFYKVHEIPFEDINAHVGEWVEMDLAGKLGENLKTQEKLKIEAFTNINASDQMVYNSMVHAWGIKNLIAKGYSIEELYAQQGRGQFEEAVYTTTGWMWWIEVMIKTDINTVKTVRYKLYGGNEELELKGLMPLISFPDARAYKMTVYMFDVSNWATGAGKVSKKEYKLTAHASGYFAYYITADMKPIALALETVTASESNKVVPTEVNTEVAYQNKLKVSGINNPFIFPDIQTYTIGDGEIWNVASQSIRTSDGQFGQYPLVCFCSDGVFTLQTGDGTVAYSRVGTPQNYERPISKVVCTTPYGIVFISNRGLCMVIGQDIEYLSGQMFEKQRDIILEMTTQISTLFAISSDKFNNYLKGCTAMVYNPKEEEIIIINASKAYSWVYNMKTKQYYKTDEAITAEIPNSLPAMQVWYGLTVKNVTTTATGSRRIKFITRPIKFQTVDMKWFERMIVRGYFAGVGSSGVSAACIWGSVDDRNFKLLRGMVVQNGSTRKDIDFGMFGKTKYRSYVIGLEMTVSTDSEIEAVEMEVEKVFEEKMR